MTFLAKKDNAKSTITNNPLAIGGTTIDLATGTGDRFPSTADGNWIATIWDKVNYPDPGDDPGMEKVLVTARSGDTLTVGARGYDGTSASAHALGSTIALLPLTAHFTELQNMGQNAFSGWETPSETPNGSITNFSTQAKFANGTLFVTRNGQVQHAGEDFTIDADYQGYTFTTAPPTGHVIRHFYVKNDTILVGGASKWQVMVSLVGTKNGTNLVFTTPTNFVSGTTIVFVNGKAQTRTVEYTETGTNQITFTAGNAPLSTDDLDVVYLEGSEPQGNAQTLNGIPSSDFLYYGMARQAIMNGNFDVYQRGTSVALADITVKFLADRWFDYVNKDGGTLPTLTRTLELLTPGDIPNARVYSRLTTNGAGTSLGVNSTNQYIQKIENGNIKLCGLNKKVTVSFWARSDIANKRICPTMYQDYGTGGSPSAVEVIKGTPITLTSTWTKYTATFTTNTLVGKTFGTNNDDCIQLVFHNMWGTTFGNTYVQTGVTAETFVGAGNIDIAQVQLCSGDVALPFQPKSYEEELRACQRYYETGVTEYAGYVTGSASCVARVYFKTTKRTTSPTIIQSNFANSNFGAGTNQGTIGNSGFSSYRPSTGTGTGSYAETWTANAEL